MVVCHHRTSVAQIACPSASTIRCVQDCHSATVATTCAQAMLIGNRRVGRQAAQLPVDSARKFAHEMTKQFNVGNRIVQRSTYFPKIFLISSRFFSFSVSVPFKTCWWFLYTLLDCCNSGWYWKVLLVLFCQFESPTPEDIWRDFWFWLGAFKVLFIVSILSLVYSSEISLGNCFKSKAGNSGLVLTETSHRHRVLKSCSKSLCTNLWQSYSFPLGKNNDREKTFCVVLYIESFLLF